MIGSNSEPENYDFVMAKPSRWTRRLWLVVWRVCFRLERLLGGHLRIGPVTIFGFNAMHWATNIRTGTWGYICFRPTTWSFVSGWNGWYFYISPDATPQMAWVAFGPGVSRENKAWAARRRTTTDYDWRYAGAHIAREREQGRLEI